MKIKNHRLKLIIFLVCFGLALIVLKSERAAGVQNEAVYRDPQGRYELLLPPNWRAVNYQDGAGNPRVDIVYRDRVYGLLKVTQESLGDRSDLDSFIRTDIDQNLRFRPGYVFGGIERFVGEHARGSLLEFAFSHAGQPKKARNYYLRDNSVTVWVLRFDGNRETLGPLRNETDLIARSFKPLR